MTLVDSTCHCSLWRLTTTHFHSNIPQKTAEIEEKGQKNHYHRHQKALKRCGLSPFFKTSLTKTGSQHIDRQAFRKTRWQWQTFCNFLFFWLLVYSLNHLSIYQLKLIVISLHLHFARSEIAVVVVVDRSVNRQRSLLCPKWGDEQDMLNNGTCYVQNQSESTSLSVWHEVHIYI